MSVPVIRISSIYQQSFPGFLKRLYVKSAHFPGEGNGTLLQYSCLENPMNGGAWWAAVHGVTKSRTRLSDFTFTFHFHAGDGNGNPLQCSCLENPRDGEAWWAAVYGVAQSWTRLKRLSSSSSSSSLPSTSILPSGRILPKPPTWCLHLQLLTC